MSGSSDKARTITLLRSIWPFVGDLLLRRKGLIVAAFVLILVNRATGLFLPASTKYLVDDVLSKHKGEMLVPFLLALAGSVLVQAVTTFFLTRRLTMEGQRIITELRCRVEGHVARLPLSFYDNNHIGAIASRVMTDVEGVRNLLGGGLIDLVGAMLTAALGFVAMVRISLSLSCLVVVILTGYVFCGRAFSRRIRPIARERNRILSEVNGQLTESLGGARVVKCYRAEARQDRVFVAGANRMLANMWRLLRVSSKMNFAGPILINSMTFLIMFLGVHMVLSHRLTLGGFMTFLALLAFLVAPALQLVNLGTTFSDALAGLDRTRELLELTAENEDPRRTVRLNVAVGEVVFNDVTFAYDQKTILRGVSFVARPGTVTALVGPSGSGKSTIISLIAGFYNASGGKVLFDGIDVATLELNSYRANLGVVLQESFLFDGSVRDNVVFARPDAPESAVQEACRIARVDEIAENLDNGYATIVGERAVRLSVGQRQRISVARAILSNPLVLLLDEPTSNLDAESEALVHESLSHLMRGRTTIMVAHRLATVRDADQILVIDHGQIVERGTHKSLLAATGRYFELYMRQQGELRSGMGNATRGSADSPASIGKNRETSSFEVQTNV